VNATDYAASGAEEPADFGFSHWVAVRRCAVVLYFVFLGAWSAAYGIPTQRELVILYVCGALACASIGRPPQRILQILVDWMPIVLVLALYDLTRGVADSLGIAVHQTAMIDFDQFVFLGDTPTQWLQAHLNDPEVINGWDVAFTLIYTSYFIAPFALAGVLWIRDHLAFVRFTRRLVTLAIAGVMTYILFPAEPPWMAGEEGLLSGIHRTTAEGWEVIGGGTAGLFSKGQTGVNLVAAVPSLHSAITALVAMFLWGRVRPWLRPLLALYPLAMGLTLMATGEHYFFDVLLGWIYAGAVMAAWAWIERRQTAKRPGDQVAGAPPDRARPEAKPRTWRELFSG
jgi:hypothetical protein